MIERSAGVITSLKTLRQAEDPAGRHPRPDDGRGELKCESQVVSSGPAISISRTKPQRQQTENSH